MFQKGLCFHINRVKLSNKPKVHINIEAPDPPSFTLPPVNQTYSTVLTMSQQHFIDGLKLSLGQADLYEKETQNQADDKLWHELRAQRLTASKFKDVCCRKKDFELLAERFMKKTIQTAAMKYGIDNEKMQLQAMLTLHVSMFIHVALL